MKDIIIPETIKTKLFVTIDIKPDSYSFGQVAVNAFDLTAVYPDGDEFHKYVKLHEVEVTVEIPPQEFDARSQARVYLKDKREKELAEHHMRIKEIDDQIRELMTLEYQPTKEKEDDEEF